ncbi:putative uncharacterized protein DDB_G0286901 [Chelonus insularis]|uniref:putative uncharacterized protein DDB_G0286901 n=1 Tax=Chelonus insularis TaxID=460826 RepID=UPI00158BA6D6|nr:putative uncharacterized protein DDB_G0286901 [Chelonus insularis]
MNDSEGTLDPRIQIELENLNTATNDINKLEIDLELAHNTFNRLFDESKSQKKEILEKLGHSCIEKAKCYYEAVETARQAQIEGNYQAQLYHKASGIHAAAKETVAVAELRFQSHKHEAKFDQTWQEMLNHATIKVMNAENQKAECSAELQKKAAFLHEAKQRVQELEEKYRKAIRKARPYFEVSSYWEQTLASQKEKIECLKQAVKNAKQTYATSFRALEEISNEIHQQRRDLNKMINGPREPGVGAELTNPMELFNEKKQNDMTLNKMNNSDNNNTDTSSNIKSCQINVEENIDNITRSIDGSESTLNQWELELQASMEKLNNLTSFKSKFDIDPHKTDFSNEHLQLNSTSSNYNNEKEDDECKLNRIEKDDELGEKIHLNEETLISSQCKSSESTDCNIHLPKTSEENTCSMSLDNRSMNTDFDKSDMKTESLKSSNELNNCELVTLKNSKDYDNAKSNFLSQLKHLSLLNSRESRLSSSLDNINTSSLQTLSAKVAIHTTSNKSEFLKLFRFQSLNSLESLKNKYYSLTNLISKKNVESLTDEESKAVPIASSNN